MSLPSRKCIKHSKPGGFPLVFNCFQGSLMATFKNKIWKYFSQNFKPADIKQIFFQSFSNIFLQFFFAEIEPCFGKAQLFFLWYSIPNVKCGICRTDERSAVPFRLLKFSTFQISPPSRDAIGGNAAWGENLFYRDPWVAVHRRRRHLHEGWRVSWG